MDTTKILPVLDNEKLQVAANEYAMKGATETIKEFYSGYSSPYRKAIEEELKKYEIGSQIKLPNIIALINDSLSKEIDAIANTAVAKTFIPIVSRFLTSEKKEVNFSEILEEFIEAGELKYNGDCEVEVVENSNHGWLDIKIMSDKNNYNLTLHEDWESKKLPVKKYQVLSLPYTDRNASQKMTVTIDGNKLEMPFTKDVLKDNFVSYIARLVIAGSLITMDCRDFEDSMFKNHNEF